MLEYLLTDPKISLIPFKQLFSSLWKHLLWRYSFYQWIISLLSHSIKHLVAITKAQHIFHCLRGHTIVTSHTFVISCYAYSLLLFASLYYILSFEQLIFPITEMIVEGSFPYLCLLGWISVSRFLQPFPFHQKVSCMQKGHFLLKVVFSIGVQ